MNGPVGLAEIGEAPGQVDREGAVVGGVGGRGVAVGGRVLVGVVGARGIGRVAGLRVARLLDLHTFNSNPHTRMHGVE